MNTYVLNLFLMNYCANSKKYLTNSNQEKVETTIFQTLKGSQLRSQWSDLTEIRTHPSFNVFLLPASIDMIGSETIKKSWKHHFPYYKSMGVFLDVQGQMTP